MKDKIKAICLMILLFTIIGAVAVYVYKDMELEKELEEKARLEAAEQEAQQQEHSIPEPYTPTEPYALGMFNDKYSIKDLLKITAATYAEAGAESDEAQRGVTSVIINRVASPNYPNSIDGVIYQNKPIQYECTVNGLLDKYIDIYINGGGYKDSDWESLERCLENVEYVLETGSIYPDNVVYQSEFKQGKGTYKQVGNTYFCYE